MKRGLIFLFTFSSLACRSQSPIEFPKSDTPRVFSPGVVSDGFSNRDMAISPDGNDLFYTLQWSYGSFSVILHSQKVDGVWTYPETAQFSGRFNDLEPAFSPYGDRLFFTSNRPMSASGTSPKDYDIWYMQKKGKGWEGPYNLGPVINSDKDEFYPSVTNTGDLYFTRDNGEKKDDIFYAAFKDGKYELPRPLPEQINSRGYDFNAYVDPAEKFMIFSSYDRSDDLGGGDLYYSLKVDGVWQQSQHFGPPINSSSLDYCPFVSSDHKYFFFTSKRKIIDFPFARSKSATEIKEMLSSYGNGNDDIYMMNFDTLWKTMK
jgi:hypothetical protein